MNRIHVNYLQYILLSTKKPPKSDTVQNLSTTVIPECQNTLFKDKRILI